MYSVYDYLGYNNICNYASEVRRPAATIPRSIVLSVTLVAGLYLAMNAGIMSAMPWQEAAASPFIVSEFVARLHGRGAAAIMTLLILVDDLRGALRGHVRDRADSLRGGG